VRDPNLGHRQTDTIGRAHSVDHVVDEAAHGLVDALDGLSPAAQHRVDERVDTTDGHAKYLLPYADSM